ncbi:hypothetical protein AB0873_30565 [Micromonospora sp. NPDC047707]|uniref:hypothetical protein n=1 Tax=Micromonospora sp. NPDC047707 TaxID=3154498 RepID=UPI0034549177
MISMAGARGGDTTSTVAKTAACAGFALVGVGHRGGGALAFAAAGHSAVKAAQRAQAIAGVAAVSYGAGLAAPGIVGAIANVTSLTVSFVLVTVLVAAMTLAARALRRADIGHVQKPKPVAA